MTRRMRWSLSIIGGLLLVAIAVLISNAAYLQRALTFFNQDQVRRVDWFEPTVELAPATSPLPIAVDASRPGRFGDALNYARSTNTSALLIWHQGQLRLAHYDAGYSAADDVQTNSIHKSVVAMLVGIAIEDGVIRSVDDPIADYLPGWVARPGKQIQIKHLLSMSSGLAGPDTAIKLFNHSMRLLHADDIAAVARTAFPERAPGERFDYQNTNAQLLVEVLEQATQKDYERYLSDKLWSRLAEQPGHLWLDRDGGTPHGFCCLIARPNDLLRLGVLMLREGRVGSEQIVPARWIQAMQEPSERNPNFGYLTWLGSPHQQIRTYSADGSFGALHSEPYLADDVAFFDGFGGQRVYVIPSEQLVIVRVGETRFDFDDSILPNKVLQALNGGLQETPLPSADAVVSRYVDLSIESAHADTLDVRIGYPEQTSGAHPLIVFSHGNGLSNDGYDALLEGWVGAGYVVAAPRHLDSGSRAEIDALTARVGRDWVAGSRALDMSAVIAQMPTISAQLPGFGGSVDTTKVIAAGHSFGAYTAQLLAGAHYEAQGDSIHPLPSSLQNSQVAAVVALSSPGEIPGVLTRAAWQEFASPQLVVTGTRDTFDFLWPDHREHFVAFDAARPGHNHLLVIDDMDHYMGNLIGRLDRTDAPQPLALATVVSVSNQFMQTYLEQGPAQGSVDRMLRIAEVHRHTNIARFDHR